MKKSRRLVPHELRAALVRGLGRALLHARAHGLSDDERAAFLELCFEPSHWYGDDDEMAAWLWKLAEEADVTERFVDAVLRAPIEVDDDAAGRLFSLLHQLARRGIAGAKRRLYESLRADADLEVPASGWDHALDLDGPYVFVEMADVLFGEPPLAARLVERASDEQLDALRDQMDSLQLPTAYRAVLSRALRETTEARELRKPEREAWLRSRTVDDVVAGVDSPTGAGWLRGWSTLASTADLERVAELLFAETEPKRIARYLMVFSRNGLPAFDARLLELAEHSDDTVRRRALNALSCHGVSQTRELALRRLAAGDHDEGTIGLMKHVFEPGDHELLEPFLEDLDDEDTAHDRGFDLLDLLDVFEHNQHTALAPLVEQVFVTTRCVFCRAKAAKLLIQSKLAPSWLVLETTADADGDIRRLSVGVGG